MRAPIPRPSPDELLHSVTASLEEHKAEGVVVIPLAGKSAIADYMVIASGRSHRHIGAMSEALIVLLKRVGHVGVTPEGGRQGDWVLIDAGDVIVHLFRPEIRAFYNLEKMWGAALPEIDASTGTLI
jgi:ribosome-associated protein